MAAFISAGQPRINVTLILPKKSEDDSQGSLSGIKEGQPQPNGHLALSHGAGGNKGSPSWSLVPGGA